MPQFNSYPTSALFLIADTLLKYNDADGVVEQINGADFVTAIQALWNRNLSVDIITENTLLDADYEFVQCNDAADFTVTIPESDSSSDYLGKEYHISNKGAGSVTLERSGSDLIGGETSVVLAQDDAVILVSDGAGYWSLFSTITY